MVSRDHFILFYKLQKHDITLKTFKFNDDQTYYQTFKKWYFMQ